MKNKLITIMIIGLLVFSTIDLTLAAKVKCPTCNGEGSYECTNCNGTGELAGDEAVECSHCSGAGTLTPSIIKKTMDASQSGGVTTVNAVLVNKETIEATATVTADLDGHTATSEETTFPPDEEVPVELTIDYVGTYTSLQLITEVTLTVNAAEITCPYCDGEGTTTDSSICPDCDGDGTLKCPDCKGSGYITEGAVISGSGKSANSGFDWTLIIGITGAVVAVAAVGGGGFFLFKKRRVSEKSLRRLSSGEFQGWVLKRLDGKPATSKDISMGIDGFSRLNQPISIKQSDSVGMNAVDLFAASLAKNRATAGMMVAFGFSDDAIRGKVRARTNYRLDIQMMTVRELIEIKHPGY